MGKDKKEKKEKKSKEAEKEESGSESDKQADLELDDDDTQGLVKDLQALVQKEGSNLTKATLFEEVRAMQVTKLFNNKLRMYLVISALFPDGSMDGKKIESREAIIGAFISNGKMSFADWIWGVEAYLSKNKGAIKAYPMALKAFYDSDLADEKDILKYYSADEKDSPGFEEAKKAGAPFLKWLEEADSEDDDDDDSD